MLFAYTYVPHQMEKMQNFIDFIFFEIWSEAPNMGQFDPTLFAAKPELQELMSVFQKKETAGAVLFYGLVHEIYDLFKKLSTAEIDQLKQWYEGNNDLEKVCANDPAAVIIRYTDLKTFNNTLHDKLSEFFKGLYSQTLLNLKALKQIIGEIDDHYKKFTEQNVEGTCPFCGISPLFGKDHSKREAYDHYLPKALYPFNSINFKNLIPACNSCNSSYKTSRDPAYLAKDPAGHANRRKFFYPFQEDKTTIQISFSITTADILALKVGDIDLEFGPPLLREELDTWRDVYGIDERYKAKVVNKNSAKYWITQILDEGKPHGVSPDILMKIMKSSAEKSPFADTNFLKIPFLEACQEMGVFDVNE